MCGAAADARFGAIDCKKGEWVGAKTDALDVAWAAPLALAAPPIADIAFFLVRNLMKDSSTS